MVNDGSTDNTEQIVKSFMTQDDRVKYVSQVNGGAGAAKSRGIMESCGDYIAFCDADDWYEENYLQEHMNHIKRYDAEISMCRTHISNSVDTGNNDDISIIEKPDILKRYLSYDGISVSLWDKVFRKDILTTEAQNEFRCAEDLFMNYMACKNANRIIKFNTTKYNWFNNTSSLSRGKFRPERVENDFMSWGRIIADCHNNFPELEETARLSSELWLCGTYRSMVTQHYHNKEQEKRIAKYIRQDGVKVLRAEKNRKTKVFLRIAYVSFPLARIVWYVRNYCRDVVKWILR